MKMFRGLLAALVLVAGQTQAGVIFAFTESGGNVLMNASGSFDVSGQVSVSAGGWGNNGIETNPAPQSDIMGDTTIGGLNAGYAFNSGTDLSAWVGDMFTQSVFGWVSAGTTQFSTYYFSGMRIPALSINTEDLVGSIWTPDNSWSIAGSFASLGMTQGIYSIVDIKTGEFITIQIGGRQDIPEPASLALLALGLLSLGMVRRKKF